MYLRIKPFIIKTINNTLYLFRAVTTDNLVRLSVQVSYQCYLHMRHGRTIGIADVDHSRKNNNHIAYLISS